MSFKVLKHLTHFFKAFMSRIVDDVEPRGREWRDMSDQGKINNKVCLTDMSRKSGRQYITLHCELYIAHTATTQQPTRCLQPMVIYCWATVADGGPTINHHWIHVAYLHGSSRVRKNTGRNIHAAAPVQPPSQNTGFTSVLYQ